ncbi:MAG TPA: hypothetical protein VMU33_19030 [Burkholderiaceae bacterium]|nr:hypothetical protein [Burkholderiaceae bacterium]
MRDSAWHGGWPATTLAAALAVAGASGCAGPGQVAPGTAETDVRARFGAPAAEYVLAEGPAARRLEYDTGRFGQRTYMVDVGGDGRVVGVQQVLTSPHFAQVRIGVDTTETIRREFGRPATTMTYDLSGLTAWQYPYRENEVWNSLMSIEFDHDGVVRQVQNGPDPLYEAHDGGGGAHRDGGGHGHR